MNKYLNINLKGLRVYLIVIFLLFGFYTYSQATGWRWWFATNTDRPEGDQGHRYFFHK